MTNQPSAELRNTVSQIVHDDNLSLKAVVEKLLEVIASVDENAHKRGEAHGYLEAFNEIDRLADGVLDEDLSKVGAVSKLMEMRRAAVARVEAIQ